MNKDVVDGLEFELTEGKSDPEKKVIRCSFRVPVNELDKVLIRIGTSEYPAVNMQARGVSFRTKKGGEHFPVEKEMVKGTITLGDQVFDVTALVIHLSDDGEKNPLFGLHFTDLGEETAKALSTFYETLKERFILTNKGGTQ
jgi:hypothetical protein